MAERKGIVRAGMVVAIALSVCGPVSAQSTTGTGPIIASGPPVSLTAGGTLTLSGPAVGPGTGHLSFNGDIVLNSGGSIGIPGAIITTGSIGRPPSLTIGRNPPAPAPAPVSAPLTQGVPVMAGAMPQPRGVNPAVNPALGVAPASVQNSSATARDSGLVGVVGASAARSSVIMATLEKVTVAGAEALTVDLAGDGLLQLQVARPVLDIHGQALSAGRGTVALSASAARDVVSGVTNAQGRNAARGVTSQGGVIVFGDAPTR